MFEHADPLCLDCLSTLATDPHHATESQRVEADRVAAQIRRLSSGFPNMTRLLFQRWKADPGCCLPPFGASA